MALLPLVDLLAQSCNLRLTASPRRYVRISQIAKHPAHMCINLI